MIRLGSFAALGAALIGGCAHVSPPDRGGAPWLRLTSEHFSLLTDLPREESQAAIRELELRRAAVLEAGWDGWPEPPGRVVVIEVRDRSELSDFGPGVDMA